MCGTKLTNLESVWPYLTSHRTSTAYKIPPSCFHFIGRWEVGAEHRSGTELVAGEKEGTQEMLSSGSFQISAQPLTREPVNVPLEATLLDLGDVVYTSCSTLITFCFVP